MRHNKTLITLITLLTLLLIPIATYAVKAHGLPVKVVQSDGSTITVRMIGDEHFHYIVASDGVVLTQDGRDYHIASVSAAGELVSSSILAHEPGHRSAAEILAVAKQNLSDVQSVIDENRTRAITREPVATTSTLFPHVGTPKALVILVEFTDTVFSLNHPKAVFDKYLNATTFTGMDGFSKMDSTVNRNHGSVSQYFYDCSYGTYRPQFDLVGPVKLANPLKHYGAGDSDYMYALLNDACKAVDDSVDFSQYDENSDGYIDLVYIIYAGYSQSWKQNTTECIWPKSGTVSGGPYDGKQLCRYGVNNELNAYPGAYTKVPLKHCNGIGLFCHEFSHCMGLPDFYPTTDEAQKDSIEALEYWDLMDGGEYTANGLYPPMYTPWEREAMGWMTIDTLKKAGTYTLKPIQDDGGKAYRIMNDNDATGHEYYILENRQKKGWNKYDPGHGMLVYHVDYDATAFSLSYNSVNCTKGHPRMTLVAADSTVYSYYKKSFVQTDYIASMAADPYPGTKNNTELTDTSRVPSTVYSGGLMHKPITNISETDSIISFNFMFDPSGINIIKCDNDNGVSLPYSDKIYTLDGRYVGTSFESLDKGIYIRNRHVIVKK